MAKATVTDLPTDILCTIFPYLSVKDFQSFTSSCRALASHRFDPTFWRTITESTFRIPSQPILQAGGARWQWLYKRLLTQTQLYTWGNDDRGSLGLFNSAPPRNGYRRYKAPYPQRVTVSTADVGIVADVQCGGWSTTVLNSLGILYLVGNIDGLSYLEMADTSIKQLVFPAGYPPTTKTRYEPSTAIRQYSTGRSHILGVADDGKVWSWAAKEARQIKLMHVDLTLSNVTRVVAGWDRSSLYVKGTGIVYWPPRDGRLEIGQDTHLVNSSTVPGTSHIHSPNERTSASDLASSIGEVTNHIVLESYIVFTTHLHKVFAWNTSTNASLSPFELATFYPTDSSPFQIRDLQGSFRSFALFTTSGAVLTAFCNLLDAFFHESSEVTPSTDPLPQPARIASLQNQDVISLAFGDWHVHALYANGTVSSFGADPQRGGAFGLGNAHIDNVAIFRGVHDSQGKIDAVLDGSKRRTVWFEPLMETRLQYLRQKPRAEASWARWSRVMSRLHSSNAMRDRYGDYFEEEGRRWEDGVTAEGNDTREMGSYFVLKVAAAGWHSAALVLVDEEKAEKARQKHIAPPPAKQDQSQKEGLINSLVNTALWSLEPLWILGRWFLSLFGQSDGTAQQAEEDEAQKVRYIWEDQPLPQLWEG